MGTDKIIRFGTVTDIDPESGRARVAFPDLNGMVSDWLPVLTVKTKGIKISFMPDIGEPVLCNFLPNGSVAGFVIGSVPCEEEGAPEGAAVNLVIIDFLDGTRIEYNRETSDLTATVEGKVDLTCRELAATVREDAIIEVEGTATVTAPSITLQGNVTIQGNLQVNGNVTNTGNMTTAGTHTDSIGKHYPG